MVETPQYATPTILWFRNDLRLTDHAALKAAIDRGGAVMPVYVLDTEVAGTWSPGAASRWWLHASLAALARDLEKLGSRLILRRGRTVEILASLAAETGATSVVCSRRFEPWAAAEEQAARNRLAEDGVELRRFAGTLLHDPDHLTTGGGGPYKVYTPFWRALNERVSVAAPLPRPKHLRSPETWPRSENLDDWKLRPERPNWAKGFEPVWQPGEAGAHRRLQNFLDDAVSTYADDRNRPDLEATSRLSPHLAHGEISPRTVWASVALLRDGGNLRGADKGLETFLKELVWREFSAHLLHHFPTLPEAPFRPEFAGFPWRPDERALRNWQRGQTGYPIVDAGMRQLWATGWMHNRVRMIVASFLIKDLLIPWQAGEAWFWDTLVDADLANNAASWQWVAGSGADAAPYFRVFNPVTQGAKFDPAGEYVRSWVPELRHIDGPGVHEPKAMQATDRRGSSTDRPYPPPMVDHKAARECALAAFEEIKKSTAD